MNDLIKKDGMIQTGAGSYVNPQFMSAQGLAQAQSFAGLPTTISSSVLSGTETPMKISTPQPLTGADGLLGTIESSANNWMTDYQAQSAQNQELAKIKTQAESSKQSYMGKLFGTKGEVALTDQEYSKTVDPVEGELKSINQEILAEQNALRKRTEAIVAQSGGLTSSVQPAIDAEKRKSASYQADLYIKQMGIQGRYDSAKAIADRKIAVELEKDKQDLELLKFDYQENKDLYTKQEQRQFESMWSDRERALNQKEATMKTFETTRIDALKTANENGAPASVKTAIANSKTAEEAISALGSYANAPTGATIPTIKSINGVDMQWNPSTGKWETPSGITGGVGGTAGTTLPLAQAEGNVSSITGLLTDKNIRSAVGPSGIARFVGRGFDTLTGGRQNFISSVEQIRSNLNLEALIGAKARGATFGALSDQELQVLASSATKMGTWAIKDKNGNVTGYSASEKDFKKELDKINNFAKLDYILKGGAPEGVGAVLMTDGKYYSQNSDGTYTQLTN